jgi:hypothetical protein
LGRQPPTWVLVGVVVVVVVVVIVGVVVVGGGVVVLLLLLVFLLLPLGSPRHLHQVHGARPAATRQGR